MHVVAYLPELSWPFAIPEGGQLERAALDLDSADQFRAAVVQGLPAAALLSGRVLGFPHVPCESPWLRHSSASAGEVERAPGGKFVRISPSVRAAAVATARNWTFLGCRSGLCNEWRVVPVGYTSTVEAAQRARMRAMAATGGAAGLRSAAANPIPPEQPLACTLHPNMIWPDG